jgi:nucleotidyltransferase substrate binding protein (TIGR01987 family)
VALKTLIDNFEKALIRLQEAHSRAKVGRRGDDYYFFRDSAIQRFEFTVEIFWKMIKSFLREKEGIDCRTPKSCIREFFSAGYLDEELTVVLLEMIDDRNLTSHTYREEVAEMIFVRLQKYIDVLQGSLIKIKR